MCPSEKAERVNLGSRDTFSDIAITAADFFGISETFPGTSMLKKGE
jgi:phosphopentomutase